MEKFPEALFDLTKVERNNGGALHLSGNITIKGTTKPIEFTSSLSKEGSMIVFIGHMDIDRSEFDVRYGSGKFFDNLGNRAINDIFTLDFELHFTEQN